MHHADKTAIIFYGPSGSGKGTQAKKLREYMRSHEHSRDVLMLSIGERLREMVKNGTYTGERMRAIVENGELVPLFYTVRLWSEWFDEHIRTGEESVIIDGIARKPAVAPILAEALDFYNLTPAAIIHLHVSPAESRRRLLARGRSDDTDEEITRRLAWFDENVKPTMKRLAEHDGIQLHEVDGEQSVDAVHEAVVNSLWGTNTA